MVLGLASGRAVAIVAVQYQAGGEKIGQHILDSIALEAGAVLDPLAMAGISIGEFLLHFAGEPPAQVA